MKLVDNLNMILKEVDKQAVERWIQTIEDALITQAGNKQRHAELDIAGVPDDQLQIIKNHFSREEFRINLRFIPQTRQRVFEISW
jgi:hypothetical protein